MDVWVAFRCGYGPSMLRWMGGEELGAVELLAILSDLVIIVVSGLILILLIALTFMALVLYRKLMPLIETTKNTSDRVKIIAEMVHGEMGKSSNTLLMVGSVFRLLKGLSKKKGGKDGEK